MCIVKNMRITQTTIAFAGAVLCIKLEFEGEAGYKNSLMASTELADRPELIGVFIRRILAVSDVTRWEDVKGRFVQVVIDSNNEVTTLTHILESTNEFRATEF